MHDLKFFTEVLMKIQVFWPMTPCRLVESEVRIYICLLNLIQSPWIWRWDRDGTTLSAYLLWYHNKKEFYLITPAAKSLNPIWELDIWNTTQSCCFSVHLSTWTHRNSGDYRVPGWCCSNLVSLYSGNAGLYIQQDRWLL